MTEIRRAFLWASVGRYLVMTVNLAAAVVMARLLAPDEYGVSVFTEIAPPGSIITSPSAINILSDTSGPMSTTPGTGMAFEKPAASTSMST